MNAIIYAVNEINRSIPHELINVGMLFDEQEITANLTSLDDKLVTKVIRSRVLLDANIIGGVETIIPLRNIAPNFAERFFTVYRIPDELTMNRQIVSALSLSYLPVNASPGQLGAFYGNNGFMNLNSNNPLNAVANRVGNSASSTGVMSNAHLELVAYNTILVYANYRAITNFGVRVVLENDNNMSNIQPRSFKNFGMLCVLAAKAYLYNKLIIPINSGMLAGGQDLGMFKSMLENYSSAEEEYRVFLKEIWGAVAFMNDTTRYNRYLGSMLSPGL